MAPLIDPAQEPSRRRNLRQLLFHTSRYMNALIAADLRQRGYRQVTSLHTTALASLPLDGASVSVMAQRAGITKQVMSRTVQDLQKLELLAVEPDRQDSRRKTVRFTSAGRSLMMASFEALSDIEDDLQQTVGTDRLEAFKRTVGPIHDALQTKVRQLQEQQR